MEYQPLDEKEKDDPPQNKLYGGFKVVDIETLSIEQDQSFYELDGDLPVDFFAADTRGKKVAEREYVDKKMTERDKEIEICFKGMEKASPIVYVDGIKTTASTSFKLSDDAIVLIDDDTSLKMISAVDQKLDKESFETYQKKDYNVYLAQLVLLEKQLSDIITNYDKEKMAVTHIVSSFEKKEIILCTMHGQVIILNSETFDEKQIFDNQDGGAVIDITFKTNYFAVAHKNGQIFIYKKADEKSAYALEQIKRDNKKKPVMPVKHDQEILAIKFSLVSDHMIIILKSAKEDAPQEKQLLLYDQKYILLNFEKKPEKLIAKENDALSLKRYFDFAPEVFIMRIQNQKGFKVFTNDKFEKICETEKITSAKTSLLTFLPDNKTVLLLDEKEVFLFSLDGVQIRNLAADDKNTCFLIAPIGTTNTFQLVSLPDCTTLFTFKENLYNQPRFFLKGENCNLFAPEIAGTDNKTFFIEMQDNKPKFKNVQFVTQNQKIIICYNDEDKLTELYDVATHKLLKKFKKIKVLNCDRDSKWLYCSKYDDADQKGSNTVRIKIEETREGNKKIPPTFEIEEVFHHILDEIQVTRDNQFLYCKGSFENGYTLYKININTKTIIDSIPIIKQFTYQMSNEEQWIIVATEQELLQVQLADKVFNPQDENRYEIERNQTMKKRERMFTYEGLTDQISFDPEDQYFIIGGRESKNLNMYNLDNLQQFKTLETHTSKNNWCYFIGSNRCLTIGNGDNQIIFWDTSDKNLWKKLFSYEKLVNPLTGWNQQLTAINMNNHTYVWNEYLTHELTDDVKALEGEEVRLEWISGPLNKLFWLMSEQYEENSKNGKEQLLPHLMKNVIHPYGYTFFSWLAYQDKTDIMKNIIEYSDVKYIRDHYGNAPLLYALKRNSSEKVSWICDFINNHSHTTKSTKLFKQISNAELILLLRLGPASVVPFFEHAIVPIEDNLCAVAKKIDEDKPIYMMVDPLKARYKDAEQDLCEQGVDESEKFSVEFVIAAIPINFEIGSWESVDFQEALDDCPNDKVFNTEYMQAVINYKGRRIAPLIYLLLAMQVLFTLCITIHAYLPGRKFMVWVNLGWVVYLFLLESLIYWVNDFTLKFNHMMNIVIIMLVTVYSVIILHQVNETVDIMLPFINLLCWLQMIMQLKQFEIIRAFVKVFMKTIEALSGFIVFLAVMLLAFSTTYNVIIKANDRKVKINNFYAVNNTPNAINGTFNGYYEEAFYKGYELDNDWHEDIYDMIIAVYDTYVTMVTANYHNEDTQLCGEAMYLFFIVLVILIANVILLNIIVALMSDSYVEVMTTMDERKFSEQSNSILKHEKLMFWKRFSGQKTCLVWMNYLDVVDNTWKSQVEAITSAVKNTFKNVLVEFEKTEVKLLGVLADQIDKADVGLNDKLDKNAAKVTNYMDKQAQDLTNVKQNLEQMADMHKNVQQKQLAEGMKQETKELANSRANFDKNIETHELGINEMNANLSTQMSKVNEDVKGTLTKSLEDQTSKLTDLSTNIDKKLTDQEKDLVGMKSELTSELDSAQNDIKSTFSKQSDNQENELKNIQSDIDKKMDSQLAAQEGMMKELDSEISKTSSDVTQTLESKADEQENQISSAMANLSSQVQKDQADLLQLSQKTSDQKTIESIQKNLTKEIVAQKENIKKSVLDSAQSQFSLVQEHLTSQIDKQQEELKQVKDYLSEEIVKQQAETKNHLTSKMESQLKEVKSKLDEQMKKKENELNDMKFELSNMITDQNMNLSAQMSEVTQQVNGLKESQNQITAQLDDLINILSSLETVKEEVKE